MHNYACAAPAAHTVAKAYMYKHARARARTHARTHSGDLTRIDDEVKEEEDRKKHESAELKQEQGGLQGYVPKGKTTEKKQEVGAEYRANLAVLKTKTGEAKPHRTVHPKVKAASTLPPRLTVSQSHSLSCSKIF